MSTMVLSETRGPIAFSGCPRSHIVYRETRGARSLHAGNQDSGRFRAIAGGRFIGSHTIPETVLRFLSRDVASIRCDSLVGGAGH